MDFLQYTKQQQTNPQKIQTNALSRYEEVGTPNRKWEAWKYTDLKTLLTAEYSKAKKPNKFNQLNIQDLDCYLIEFQNGHLEQDLVQGNGFRIEQLESISEKILNSENPFDLLNIANGLNGKKITIESEVDKPIVIAHRCNEEFQNQMNFVQNAIEVKTHGKATIIELFFDESVNSGFYHSLTTIQCDASSNLQHIKVVDELNQSANNTTAQHNFNSIHAQLSKDSQFFSFASLLGGQKVRNDIFISINEPGAHVEVNGLYALDEKQHCATYSIIDHLAAHTTSKQIYKGILQDQSHGVFNGRVIVRKDSQQITSDQINKNLLLSKAARIDTKPQLEIDADDVKCAHGATIGQLEPNEVFYLQTRGIPEKKAKQLLAYAFVNEAVDTITDEAARKHISKYLSENLKRRDFLGKGQ